jgi:glutathione synthase/RimK-type ligase-like ATP-grasp enzyme
MNYIFGYQFGLNHAASHMICEDKSTTSEMLSCVGIPNVEHRCFMSPMNMKYVEADGNWKEILAMLEKYKRLVLKDNKGTGGLSVYRVENAVELENAAQVLFQSAHSISVSPYYDILQEYRLIFLDGEIKLVYHKERQHLTGDGIHTIRELYADYLRKQQGEILPVPAEDSKKILKQGETYALNWKHNLGQGAVPVFDTDDTLTAPLKELAKAAASCVGIRFASIDIVKIRNNKTEEYRILEINSGVMMEYLSRADNISRQTAKEIYREAIQKMLSL